MTESLNATTMASGAAARTMMAAATAVLALGAAKARAQEAEAAPDSRNLEGIYLAERMAVVGVPLGVTAPPPYGPEAAALAEHQQALIAKGTPLAESQATCRPFSSIGLGGDRFPAEIVQTDDMVVILNEEGRTRWQIFLDRGHPATVPPSFWGDSVGHWEGDTLVVDTIGFNGKLNFVSDKARIVSRLRKVDEGRKIEIAITIDDPVNYTRPYERIGLSARKPELQMLEFQCEENLAGAMEGLIAK